MPTSKKRKNKDTKKTVSFRESFNSHANFQNKIVNNLPDTKLDPYHKKVSDIIQNFSEPLINMANTEEAIKVTIDFCIVAWNLAVSKNKNPEKADDLFNSYINAYDEEIRESMRNNMNFMISRKDKLFSEDNVMIADYQLYFDKDGNMNFSVASVR